MFGDLLAAMNVCDPDDGQLVAKMTGFRLTMSSLELLCLTISLLVNIFFWFVLYETKMLLNVSRMLLFNAILAGILTMGSRYFIVINMLTEETLLIKSDVRFLAFIHDTPQMMINLNEGMIVIVCWFTLSWDTQIGGRMLGCFNCIVVFLPWALAASILSLEWLKIIPSNPLQIFYCALNIICLFALLYFASVSRFNYRKQCVGNLLGKFRASVQIRTLKVMQVVAFLTIIRTTVTNAILILIKYFLLPSCLLNEARNISYAIDITIALHALLQPFFMIRTNPEMGKICRNFTDRFLKCQQRPFYKNITPHHPTKTSITPTIVIKENPNFSQKSNLSSKFEETPKNQIELDRKKSATPDDRPKNALGQPLWMDNSQDEHFKQLLLLWNH